MLKGEYELNFSSIFEYLIKLCLNKVFILLPSFLSVIAICVFCGITQNFKSSFLSESTSDIIFFICFLFIVLLLSSGIISIYQESKIAIENISKLTQIMSPIILTLMVATGGIVSANVYKPAVVFLSNGVISIFTLIVLPLIGLMLLFSIVSNFSLSIKLNKFIDLASSIIKWIIGIVVTIQDMQMILLSVLM
jgi:stage III sporulation protein AE